VPFAQRPDPVPFAINGLCHDGETFVAQIGGDSAAGYCVDPNAKSPDFIQVEVSLSLAPPSGITFNGTLDAYGNVYGGVGPNAGKSLSGPITFSVTTGTVTPSAINTGTNEEKLINYFTGETYSRGGGVFLGGQYSSNKYGSASSFGFFSPQIGVSTTYAGEKPLFKIQPR
jgi:hypothetical protein